MLFQRCKNHIANPLIELNGELICTICGPIIREESKPKRNKLKSSSGSSDGFSEITCSLCKKIKKRKRLKGYEYVDDVGNKWLRRRCPDCRPAMIYKQNIKRDRKLEDRHCLSCNTLFRPKNSRHLYCTSTCISKTRILKPSAGIIIKVAARAVPEDVVSGCLYCGSIIRSKGSRSYCNKKCSNRYQYANNNTFKARLKSFKEGLKSSTSYKTWRQYKRLYGDRITVKSRLSGVTWKDLDVFFNNCPPNHKIEIIVPLYDENVCGLFVPWNFKYQPIK